MARWISSFAEVNYAGINGGVLLSRGSLVLDRRGADVDPAGSGDTGHESFVPPRACLGNRRVGAHRSSRGTTETCTVRRSRLRPVVMVRDRTGGRLLTCCRPRFYPARSRRIAAGSPLSCARVGRGFLSQWAFSSSLGERRPVSGEAIDRRCHRARSWH
jgi:hypothetical protein